MKGDGARRRDGERVQNQKQSTFKALRRQNRAGSHSQPRTVHRHHAQKPKIHKISGIAHRRKCENARRRATMHIAIRSGVVVQNDVIWSRVRHHRHGAVSGERRCWIRIRFRNRSRRPMIRQIQRLRAAIPSVTRCHRSLSAAVSAVNSSWLP